MGSGRLGGDRVRTDRIGAGGGRRIGRRRPRGQRPMRVPRAGWPLHMTGARGRPGQAPRMEIMLQRASAEESSRRRSFASAEHAGAASTWAVSCPQCRRASLPAGIEPGHETHPLETALATGLAVSGIWGRRVTDSRHICRRLPDLPARRCRSSISRRTGRWSCRPYRNELRPRAFAALSACISLDAAQTIRARRPQETPRPDRSPSAGSSPAA